MPSNKNPRTWYRSVLPLSICLLVVGCTLPPTEETSGDSRAQANTWGGRPMGPPPTANPGLKGRIIERAEREWQYFGRQTIVHQGEEESIPHVGYWEDENRQHSGRVNSYWRAVGKPGLDGMDCHKPWSAAFMSWVMQSAGVPTSQFPRATAHWVYLTSMIDAAYLPGRYFVPRRISDYSPEPGDLVCAYRSPSRLIAIDAHISSSMLRGLPAHCDLVVGKSGQRLETIGGNVRNSVSKSSLELDARGHLKPTKRRPWFIVMQNRL